MADENENVTAKSSVPFWKPWGIGGCLGRSLLFLIGMLLIIFFMALVYRGCNDVIPSLSGNRDPFSNDSTTVPVNDPYGDVRDTSYVDGWNDSIPGVSELPDPSRNFIPPVDSTYVIVNPDDSLSQIVEDQLIVYFNSDNLKSDMASFARQFKQVYPGNGYEILYYNPTAGTMLLGVPKEKLMIVADELPQKITGIDFCVATNEILAESDKPTDPGFATAKYDEYFKLIQAYEAWSITKGSPDVKVAIVDSYFDLSNKEISDRYVDLINIPTKTANVYPPATMPSNANELASYCHGSHVAGIAIGAQNNGVGCSGIAPECSWIPISLGGQLTAFNLLEGIMYAIYHDADVVNFSIGRSFPESVKSVPLADQVTASVSTDKRGEALWQYIIKIANDHKCVLVTSAGNETILMGLDPKNRSNDFIKVEAVDGKGQMAEFSNYGMVPEANLEYSTVSAPGVNLWSVSVKHCAPLWKKLNYVVSAKDGLQEMSGTSMAAPVVAGAVALLKSKNKDLTTEQVIKILKLTAKQTDAKHRIGPIIQIKDALDATGGDLLNFDDLMSNHDLLIGKWKSTRELMLSNSNNEKIDDMWTYFIFTSTSEGTLEMHTINSKKIYRASLRVKWGKDAISITQLSDAVAEDGDKVNKDDFVCRPNDQRLLEASCTRNGKERYKFQLEKVN